ncbi:hypothetical protein [Roseovarius sp. D0-M9]|uniref:hypothetical protein n=1 Tax=Roseovarius sp. D0-M9 TaxID=3127117 RepID=UPI0030103232
MTDWGLPDWRSADAYDLIDTWDWLRWRWEFYRRRDDLRRDFWDRAQSTYELYHRWYSENPRLGVDPETMLKPKDAGFTAQAYVSDEYKMIGLPNPSISEQPRWAIEVFDRPNDIDIVYASAGFDTGPMESPNLVTKIDLDRPLAAQIETLEKEAKAYQKNRHGKLLQSRKHFSKWGDYLRALDAREDGAKWVEIADMLRLSPSEPGNAVKAAKDTFEAADRLRFNFPN